MPYTLLLVDDDREFRAELREALVLSGYGAEAFPAAAAKCRLREAMADVVLLGLKMDRETDLNWPMS